MALRKVSFEIGRTLRCAYLHAALGLKRGGQDGLFAKRGSDRPAVTGYHSADLVIRPERRRLRRLTLKSSRDWL
jgi:hypothetical protein